MLGPAAVARTTVQGAESCDPESTRRQRSDPYPGMASWPCSTWKYKDAAVLPSVTLAYLIAWEEAYLRRYRLLVLHHPLLVSLKYQTKELNF